MQWLSGEYRSRDAYGGAIAETIKRRGDEDAWINWQTTRARPSIMLLILNFEDGWLALSGRGGSRRCWTLIDPPTNVPAVVCAGSSCYCAIVRSDAKVEVEEVCDCVVIVDVDGDVRVS